MGSGDKSSSNFKQHVQRTESETAITGVPYNGKPQNNINSSIDVEAFAMGDVRGKSDQVWAAGNNGILRETDIKQSWEEVL